MKIHVDGPEGSDYDHAYWWSPLEAVAELVKDMPEYADFDIDDFMLMCRYTQAGVRLIEYKHIHTRRSIALSDDGLMSFCYVSRRPPLARWRKANADKTDLGFYAPDHSLWDALDRLELPLGAEMKRSLVRWSAQHDDIGEGSATGGDLPVL